MVETKERLREYLKIKEWGENWNKNQRLKSASRGVSSSLRKQTPKK